MAKIYSPKTQHRRMRFSVAIIAVSIAASSGISQWLLGRTLTSNDHRSLLLEIIDGHSKKPTAARFSLNVDGKPYYPKKIGKHGLRFVSIHKSRNQVYPVTYANGGGPVEIEVPKSARRVAVHVSKGFEYLPAMVVRKIDGKTVRLRVELKRWANFRKKGWVASDAHLHYDRLKPADNKQWLTMLAGDDLHMGCFMVLKGGQVPGIWARQYAYGKAGEAFDGDHLICSGEEYRDGAQGHINLFGVSRIIEPISTGGIGKPPVRFNYPPLYDVFAKSRQLDGFGGVAHGGSLGREPTAVLDAVLGKVDFFEIANAHLYSCKLWYRLLNCGYDLPPTAGTDLPNYPYRDAWQPFLGSMRMYVQLGEKRDFSSWKKAVQSGRVIVSSGPLLSVKVSGSGPGETVSLPKEGGAVMIDAELSSPVGLRSFEIIQNGEPIAVTLRKNSKDKVQRLRIRKRLRVTKSCWLAARGEGVVIDALQKQKWRKQPWIKTNTIAHTAPIRVIVGEQAIRSKKDVSALIGQLLRQQEYYRSKGLFAEAKHRLRTVGLFDQAISRLKKK